MAIAEQISLYSDRAIKGGLLLLLAVTPLAFGSVHPWAFMLLEATSFLLAGLWLGRLLLNPFAHASCCRLAVSLPSALLLPCTAFVGFLIFQLTPLPPSVLQSLSPATYEAYTRSLPGWPEKTPYAEWLALDGTAPLPNDGQESAIRSTIVGMQSAETALKAQLTASQLPSTGPWLPLSLAPALSKTSLLKLLAYAMIFSLALLYPFEIQERSPWAEERFVHTLLRVILGVGAVVAFLGVVQHFTWNGKILWFFVPEDWSGPALTQALRASGPFINSDHFANYLALIFPLALLRLISHGVLRRRSQHAVAWLLFGVNAVLFLMGILLSLSRAGWISIILGVSLLFYFLPIERRHQFLGATREKRFRLMAAVIVGGVILALLLIGSSGRNQIDRQLEQTVLAGASLRTRLEIWQDSLGIIRDFPLFGVGMGAWPEVFPRYQRPPWTALFMREAHNDYLQSLAELGIIGSGLLLWLFAVIGQLLYRGLTALPMKKAPLYAALLASLGVMAFHEVFDFNLQIPANAFLFSVLLGLALRLMFRATNAMVPIEHPRRTNTVAPLLGSCLAMATLVVLSVLALQQDRISYPHNLCVPTTVAEAQHTALTYPALASPHVALFSLTEGHIPLDRRLAELRIALWLDPREPFTRDLYAQGLRQMGREEEGLQEMSRSILLSPKLSTHDLLNVDKVDTMSRTEQEAIENGLRQALALGYRDAAPELGAFYSAVERFIDAAQIYERAVRPEDDEETRRRALINAGLAFARAGAMEHAEARLRQASALDPRDVRPYRDLAIYVFAAKEELDRVKAVVQEGIQKGADPLVLLLALADAAQKMGDDEEAKRALIAALKQRSSSFAALFALGQVYLQEHEFAHAATVLQRATKARPDDPAVFFSLALAEEGRYQFAAAQDAYEKALSLNPQDVQLWKRYQVFHSKLTASK